MKLHNQSKRSFTIKHDDKTANFGPGQTMELPKELGEKLLRMYPHEIVDQKAVLTPFADAPKADLAPPPPAK